MDACNARLWHFFYFTGGFMAQYDGSIKINTQINVKSAEAQLGALEVSISKSANKIADLRSKLDSLKTAQIPTQEYSEIAAQIEKAQHSLDGLLEKQAQMQAEGKTSGTSWERISAKIAETRSELSYAKGELQALVDEGKAFTVGDPAQEERLTQHLQAEEARLASMAQKRDLLNSKVQAAMEEEQRLASIKENATVTDQRLVDLLEQRRQLLVQIKDLEKAGVTEGYAEYDNALADLSDVQGHINGIRDMRDAAAQARASYVGLGETVRQTGRIMARGLVDIPIAAVKAGVRGLVSAFQKLGGVVKNVAVNTFHKLGSAIKTSLSKAGSLIGNVVSKMRLLGSTAKKSFGTVNKSAKKTGGLMGTIASRFKGIALSLLLFNWVTKAFNGAVKAIKDGFSNLYKDNEKFKTSVDNLRASVLTLKNAFAAAFRPLVDIAIPYIQMAADKLTELLTNVGQFTAAITGQATYTKAIKQTADAFKDAKKAAEGYLSPLDEINKFSSKKDDEEEQTGIMFEEVPIEQKFKDMAEKVKDVFADLFAPIKEAWDREGEFVMDSWKYALDEVWGLIKDIGRDFLTVWQQEETISIFQDILRIIGDIGLTVGNLAAKFREAWNENEVGLHILEKIRDILGIIIGHIRNAADATVEWSENIDFYPLLDAFNRFLESLEPAVDAISGILEDFYTKVMLPLGTWVLEKGLPELLQVFIDFNNKVDWETLRTNISEFWEHLEPFSETIGEGLIIFIGRLSDALANFINSPEFSAFLTKIEEWMDSVSPEEVADGFQKIAIAIIALKAASSALSFISTNFSIFSAVANILKGTLSLLPGVISALGGALSLLASPIGIIVAAVAALVAGFIYAYNTSDEFRQKVSDLKDKFTEFWEEGLKPIIQEWGERFRELWEEHLKPCIDSLMELLKVLWEDVLIPIAGWLVDSLSDLLPAIEEVVNTTIELLGWLIDVIKGLADVIGDSIGLIADLLRGDWSSAWEHAESIVETVFDGITGTIERAVGWITDQIDKILDRFRNMKEKVGDFFSGGGSGDSGESYSARSYSMRSASSPYAAIPAIAKLVDVPIPGYATGQVIPRRMKQHLAILGDNTRETEVVSPLSTIEQAVTNAMVKAGVIGSSNNGGNTYNVKAIANGNVIFDMIIEEGKTRMMSSGRNPFDLGTT